MNSNTSHRLGKKRRSVEVVREAYTPNKGNHLYYRYKVLGRPDSFGAVVNSHKAREASGKKPWLWELMAKGV